MRIDVTNIKTDAILPEADSVTLRPTKKIDAYKVFVEGKAFDEGGTLQPLESKVATNDTFNLPDGIEEGDEIEVLGRIGDVWCPGTKETA